MRRNDSCAERKISAAKLREKIEKTKWSSIFSTKAILSFEEKKSELTKN